MFEKMDAVIKQKWITALRSGEYKQFQGRLSSDDGKRHCCIGVLAIVLLQHDRNKWQTRIVVDDGRVYALNSPTDILHTMLASDDLCKLKLYQYVGDFDSTVSQLLASKNDLNGDEHWSFNQIADWIEENL